MREVIVILTKVVRLNVSVMKHLVCAQLQFPIRKILTVQCAGQVTYRIVIDKVNKFPAFHV